MSTRAADHITMATQEQSSAASSPEQKGCAVVDLDAYPLLYAPEFLGHAKKEGGGSGYVRIYDHTNSQELALIEITSASFVMVKDSLTNYATSGLVCIELQIYTDGTGTIYIHGAALQVN